MAVETANPAGDTQGRREIGMPPRSRPSAASAVPCLRWAKSPAALRGSRQLWRGRPPRDGRAGKRVLAVQSHRFRREDPAVRVVRALEAVLVSRVGVVLDSRAAGMDARMDAVREKPTRRTSPCPAQPLVAARKRLASLSSQMRHLPPVEKGIAETQRKASPGPSMSFSASPA